MNVKPNTNDKANDFWPVHPDLIRVRIRRSVSRGNKCSLVEGVQYGYLRIVRVD